MGRPKQLLPFGPESMLGRVVRILSEVVDPIVVVTAAGHELPPLPPGVLVARDEHEDLGPLEGLAVGLSMLRGRAEAAYVSSCDVPLLRPDFVRAMIEQLGRHDLAMPSGGQYHHPLAAVYRTDLEETVRGLISAGRMRPLFLVDECDAKLVDVETLRSVDPELDSLRNTNTPEDYQSALARAGFDENT